MRESRGSLFRGRHFQDDIILKMPDKNRQARYYRLTSAGRKQLMAEESKWKRLAQAIAKVMKRRPEEV